MVKKRVRIPLDSVAPGMVLADSVINEYGAVIVWQDTELNDALINKLNGMAITHVVVFELGVEVEFNRQRSEWRSITPEVQFMETYEKEAEDFKQVFADLSAGKPLDRDTTNQIVDSIVTQKQENRNIVDCVMQVRAVDEYTYHHCVNVSMLAMMMGNWLKMDEPTLRDLVQAGLLHDLGKSQIPAAIINKPGKLTEQEYAEMKKHPEIGYHILNKMTDIPQRVAQAVLTHHEREDGSGYPLHLQGNRLHLFAKILTITDIFDAMTANRSYKKHQTPFAVFDLMQNGSFGVLDPALLKVFLTNVTHYYIGKEVLLNTDDTAEIIFMNQMDFARPMVRVGEQGFLDLTSKRDTAIVDFV